MKTFFAPIFFVLFVSSASAAVAGSGSLALAIRQAPPSNAECASSCAAIGNSINTCQASDQGDAEHLAQCSCSDDISSQWGKCYDCAVSHGMDKATAQTSLTSLVNACQKIGSPFKTPPTLSASGGGSSGSSSGSGSSKNSGVANFGTRYAVGIAVVLSGMSSAFLYA